MTFADVETARKMYQEYFLKGLTTSVIVAIAFSVPLLFLSPIYAPAALIFVFFAGFSATSFATNKYRTAFRKAYKGYFVEQNLNRIFTEVVYDHQKGFTPDRIRESGMICLADRFYSNDLTLAKYKNIPFAQADIKIVEEHTDNDGHTHEHTVMKGRYLIFEFPKKFAYRLEVIGKKFHNYTVTGKNPKMVKLETESTEFNHNFKVFGQDGFESFYLLNPAIIAKIEDLATHYDYKLLLGFYDNKLIVALDDGKDSFEPPRFTKPIDEKTEMDKVAADIKVITDFVDLVAQN